MFRKRKFHSLTLLSDDEKKKYRGGSLWTGAVAFAVVSSTIMSLVQLIYNIINSANSSQNSNSSSTSNSNYANNSYSSFTSTSGMFVRLSNTPLRTTVNYNL